MRGFRSAFELLNSVNSVWMPITWRTANAWKMYLLKFMHEHAVEHYSSQLAKITHPVNRRRVLTSDQA